MAQVVFEPIEKDIYTFLIRQNNKGNISFNETIQPISRLEIGKLLAELKKKRELLSTIEIDDLSYFLTEFGQEMALNDSEMIVEELGWISQDGYNKLRLFHSYASNFSFIVDPLVGVRIENEGNNRKLIRSWGFNTYGYINNAFGFQLNFTDNTENGNLINPNRAFSPERGINVRGGEISDVMDYSFLNAGITYNWDWGYLSLQKTNSLIGSGYESRIILSDKAPSFTKVEIDLKMTDWLRLHYFHGFLHSDIIDSSTYRTTSVKNRPSFDRRKKYFAFHILSITPNNNWTINLGESVIYSDYLEPIYFIPCMFFRLADHFNQRKGSDTGDNAQIFFDINYKNFYLKTKFYSTIFIDELSVGAISGDEKSPSSIGYTFGLQTSDFLFNNSLLTVEYSRLNPFLYMNGNDAQTYTSHSYELGHWIGSNSDLFLISYYVKIFNWVNLDINYKHIRKGEEMIPNAQYEFPYPDFLQGLVNKSSRLGISLRFSIQNIVGVQIKYEYQQSNASLTNLNNILAKSNLLDFSVNVGFF